MKHLRKTIDDLEYYEVPGDENSLTIILFHGYGADAFDLLPLSQACRLKPAPRWIFPSGTLSIPIMPGYVGRAWFPLDIELLKKALQNSSLHELVAAFPSEIKEARQTVEKLIDHLNVQNQKIVIGGFSQGAVLATDVALNASQSFAGLIILSGTLIHQKQWSLLAPKHQEMLFFQSHGSYDPILPLEGATALEKLLLEANLKGELHTFEGGHEIPQPILVKMKEFIEKINN